MRKASKRLNVARKMPELKHSFPDEDYNVSKSEVVQWLMSQPEVQQYVFDRVANNGKYKLILFDKERGTWKGVDYEN